MVYAIKQWLQPSIIGIVLCALLLTGCQADKVMVGGVGTHGQNEIVYRYQTFTGTERGQAQIEAGQVLILAYSAEVTKGTLTLAVEDPRGETVWEAALSEDTPEQQVEISIEQDGSCTILATGDRTGGSLAVSWTVR